MITVFIPIRGTKQNHKQWLAQPNSIPTQFCVKRKRRRRHTPHNRPDTRDQIHRLRLDTRAIVSRAKGIWLGTAPSNYIVSMIRSIRTFWFGFQGGGEGGHTPGEKAVFGEDCDGVDDEDDD